MGDTIRHEHESFGLLSICRTQGSAQVVFGSSIKHHNTIILRIQRACLDRSLSQDWFHANEQLIEVEMSQTQFADAITSLNIGDGVPVTIRAVGMKQMAKCPFIGKMEVFHQETKEAVKEVSGWFNKVYDKAKEMMGGATLKKRDMQEVVDGLRMLKQQLESNLPFLERQLDEQMDKTVTEAKDEIEAFISNVIHKTGKNERECEGYFGKVKLG